MSVPYEVDAKTMTMMLVTMTSDSSVVPAASTTSVSRSRSWQYAQDEAATPRAASATR